MRRETIARLQRAADCRFGRERADGFTLAMCATHAEKVRLLDELAWIDSEHPELLELAGWFVREYPRAPELARALHAFAQGLTFRDDRVETFASSLRNIANPVGDCDDSARLLIALARATGRIPAILRTLEDEDGTPIHAVAMLDAGRGWEWAETSVRARFGESPLEAAIRLGIRRADIRPAGMGAIGDELVPADSEAYSAAAISLLGEITSGPAAAVLTPFVAVTLRIVGKTAGEAASSAAASVAASAALAYGKGIASAAASAIGAVAEVVPILAALVDIFTAVADMWEAERAELRRRIMQTCQDDGAWREVVGTGVGGAVLPCDIFVKCPKGDLLDMRNGVTGILDHYDPARAIPARIGLALKSWTEPPHLDEFAWPHEVMLNDQDGRYELLPFARKYFGASVGVPADRQSELQRLREAIELSADGRADGGQVLWSLYLDLIRAEFAAGHLTERYCRFLWALRSAGSYTARDRVKQLNIALMLSEYGPSRQALPADICAVWEDRGFREAWTICENWRKTVEPMHYADQQALARKVADLEAAAAELVAEDTDKGGRIKLNPARISQLTAALRTRRGASAPAKVVAVGALGAAAWYWGPSLLRFLRRM